MFSHAVGAPVRAPGRPRRVLVTGGAGFVGSHLTGALLARGDRVTILDDLSTGRMENLTEVLPDPNLEVVVGDVRDRAQVEGLVNDADVVYHLAAVVGVQLVVDDALRTIRTNIIGTESVLDSARYAGVPVLLASTSEVYGKCAHLPANEEDDVLIGASSHSRWGYAASKLVDEMLALAYYHQMGLPVVVFRMFNTVGPRQTGRYGMVVPRFVGAALAGRDLPVHGDGQQSRTFLHVKDAVAGILALSTAPGAVGRVVNIGSDQEITILDLAHRILARTGGDPGRIRFIPYDRAYGPGYEDVRRRIPDTSRLVDLTGWSPQHSLEDIIDDVVADLSMHPELVAAAR